MINSSSKIALIAISVLLITFSALLIIQYVSTYTATVYEPKYISNNKSWFMTEKEFFDGNFNGSTIFLLGSSHVGYSNVTQINNLIPIDTVTVYNLAQGGDTPKKRISQMNQIIETSPSIVFYGISYRDFEFPLQEFNPIISEDIQKNLFCNPFSYLEFNFPTNPHLMIKYVFDRIMEKDHPEKLTIKNTPFTTYSIKNEIPTKLPEDKTSEIMTEWNLPINKQINMCAINNMIEEFQNNGIEIVIFTTPIHEQYLDNLNNVQKNQFQKLLKDLKSEYKIKIYEFEDKYHGLEIWNDVEHISYHKQITKFNEDIAEMIIMEIKS